MRLCCFQHLRRSFARNITMFTLLLWYPFISHTVPKSNNSDKIGNQWIAPQKWCAYCLRFQFFDNSSQCFIGSPCWGSASSLLTLSSTLMVSSWGLFYELWIIKWEIINKISSSRRLPPWHLYWMSYRLTTRSLGENFCAPNKTPGRRNHGDT